MILECLQIFKSIFKPILADIFVDICVNVSVQFGGGPKSADPQYNLYNTFAVQPR